MPPRSVQARGRARILRPTRSPTWRRSPRTTICTRATGNRRRTKPVGGIATLLEERMTEGQQATHYGLVGLAVMGANLALNIADHGFPIAVYNRTHAVTEE